ncbi:MAG: dihydroorotate dehydrogenase electron transfer subunit [Bacteroidales bacterium]|jgi:dihydroorotate dehydrogenase electron transfer subunit|nr:dihydroorotate dehydrogenase electron transfer subunit [Bacteroidales bacterium]
MPKRTEDLRITGNRKINKDHFILDLLSERGLPELKPGQFVQVRIDGSQSTFLRRPISIHDVDYESNTIRLLVQIVGKGTQKLSEAEPGTLLNLIYPLGNTFSMPSGGEKILLIGGGCGVAPLLFLAKHLKSSGFVPDILLGFRNSERIMEIDEYSAAGNVFIATEDGSEGAKGYVTDHPLLKSVAFDRVFCCGPERMMKAVARYCGENNINCEVSLEKLMACGIGVCLCCVAETVRGNVCTCTEGPVFNTKELKW